MNAIIYDGQKVITTDWLATAYGTNVKRISENFLRNKEKFVEKKHFFCLEGEILRVFKRHSAQSGMVDWLSDNTSKLYLWTERGANRHCKTLDTDKAWEQFDNLEETYFRVKEARAMMPRSDIAQCFSGLAKYLRIQRTIMLEKGCTPLEVALMSKQACDLCGVPTPDSLTALTIGEQLMLHNWKQ